jgi:hypothetical protein
MAGNERDSVLHFECDACGTHLGVDDSLAGLEAPCPKCGKLLVAPLSEDTTERIPSSGVTRGVSGGGGFLTRSAPTDYGIDAARRKRSSGGSRKVSPNSGGIMNQDERENLKTLLKILIATALVALVVALVVWYLKNQ